MSDQQKVSQPSKKYFLPCFIFTMLGIFLHPAFFFAALVCLTLAMPTRKQRMLAAVVSVTFMVVWFGYSVGKDMALRDNQLEASNQHMTP